MTRGNKWWVDRLIGSLVGVQLPFEFRDDVTKPMLKSWFELGVRPIQLWEIVYPEPCHELMCNTILNQDIGETQHKSHEKWLRALRFGMGIKKLNYNWDKKKVINDFKNKIPMTFDGKIPIVSQNVEVIGVGFKPDRYTEHGEML